MLLETAIHALPYPIFIMTFAFVIDRLSVNNTMTYKKLRSAMVSGFNIYMLSVFDVLKYNYRPSFLKIYYNINDYSIQWLIFSFIFGIVAIDILLWFAHYCLHNKKIFKWIHAYHHQFTIPNAFDFSAAHPIELFSVYSMYSVIPLFFPIYVGILQFHGLLSNVLGILSHGNGLRLFSKFIDSDFHNTHHAIHSTNYGIGIFTSYWDKLFGTYTPPKIRAV
ncbi:MAG: fatty acid hydroxylase [Edafosvirus sp.]|uniref:Fatty acid hydroxylase n=1 Tax=Edafosvirus sp. TaxID=2487765 RepID=A0A3G4ZUD9_9VIRU|nr:MAG: fatty acid hydroxylase [Edafosvirus sp.]